MSLTVDRTMNRIENSLSELSAYPGLGLLTGTLKVAVGLTQSTVGIACGIFSLVPAASNGNWSLTRYSGTHIKHGLGNVAVGALEALPVVGMQLDIFRRLEKMKIKRVHVFTGHEGKWMPYASLVERDWYIDGYDDDAVERVKRLFEYKLAEKGGRHNLSERDQIKLAKEAVKERGFIMLGG